MTPPHDETKMSNRERALEVFRKQANATFEMTDPIETIERALDEKDIENRKLSDKYVDKSFAQGQKEMRDRAAKSCEWLPMTDCMDSGHDGRYCKTCEVGHDAADLLAGKIRALPIEGD